MRPVFLNDGSLLVGQTGRGWGLGADKKDHSKESFMMAKASQGIFLRSKQIRKA